MEVIKTDIEGVLIIEPKVFGDKRGYFFESFSQREFDEKVAPILGHTIHFVQDNESMSTYGVMRGLHFQRPPYTQSKLVRCVKGAVLDVAVDIRKGSPTYGQHIECLLCGRDPEGERIAQQFAQESLTANPSPLTEVNPLTGSITDNRSTLTGKIGLQFFIPKGFAHGFAVLSDTAVFQYKCDEFYHPEADGGINILDDSLGIDWRIPTDQALLSEKDTKHPLLQDFDSPFSLT
jgi:dTDP-4-dehydrorhamnose 3,5-epimerase